MKTILKTLSRNASLVAALVAFLAAPAIAHHSFAMYDMNQTKTVTGKMTRYIPGANHAQLLFQLVDNDGNLVMEKGKPVQWGVETGSAAALSRQGITVESFPVGTIITVVVHPLRDGRPFGAMAGELVKCGNAMPKGGCTKATGQVFLTGSAQ
jgi:hypothetical protein